MRRTKAHDGKNGRRIHDSKEGRGIADVKKANDEGDHCSENTSIDWRLVSVIDLAKPMICQDELHT